MSAGRYFSENIFAGTRHGPAVPGAGEMSRTVSARPHRHQQSGPHVHVVRLPARQPDRLVQRHGGVRGVHVLPDQGAGAPRGNRRAGASA